MIGKTNTGGGGLSTHGAVLVVTAPAGSAITATKSGVTERPKVWPHGDDSASSDYVFSLRSTGTWTITATKGAQSRTETITVPSVGWYTLEISYTLHLVQSGIVVSPYAAVSYRVNDNGYYASAAAITEDVGYLVCQGSDVGYYAAGITADFTKYSSLVIDGDFYYSSDSDTFLAVWTTDKADGQNRTANRLLSTGLPSGAGSVSLDISSLTGNYVAGIGFVFTNPQKIANFYLV